jgi:hypothetical protein
VVVVGVVVVVVVVAKKWKIFVKKFSIFLNLLSRGVKKLK